MNTVPIGVVGRPHGLSGEVKVFVQKPFHSWFWGDALSEKSPFKACVVGSELFSILSAKRVGRQGALALGGLNSFDQAKAIQGKPFGVPEALYRLAPPQTKALSANLVGFRLYKTVDDKVEFFGTIHRHDPSAGSSGIYEVLLPEEGHVALVPADEATIEVLDAQKKSACIREPELFLVQKGMPRAPQSNSPSGTQ